MKTFKRLLASKEVRAILAALREAARRFNNPEFKEVQQFIERAVMAQPDYFTSEIQNGMAPRQVVYSMIVNRVSDLAEEGYVQSPRGLLSRIVGNLDWIQVFDASLKELVQLGVITEEQAEQRKVEIRKHVKSI
jgi:hypothetical protein